jgi:phospholipase/carboxylesterase
MRETAITLLPSIEINPQQPPVGCVILLHGLGADGNDFVSIVQDLHLPASLPLRFVFPHAPIRKVTINNHFPMRAWYDIFSLGFNQQADHEGISTSIQQLNLLIQAEINRGIPANKIILAGFSQGSVIALLTGLSYPEKLGGIMALSGYIPHGAKVIPASDTPNATTPIFVAHGEQDAVVPFFMGAQVPQMLQQLGYHPEWHAYQMGHSVIESQISDILHWIEKVYYS